MALLILNPFLAASELVIPPFAIIYLSRLHRKSLDYLNQSLSHKTANAQARQRINTTDEPPRRHDQNVLSHGNLHIGL